MGSGLDVLGYFLDCEVDLINEESEGDGLQKGGIEHLREGWVQGDRLLVVETLNELAEGTCDGVATGHVLGR